MRKDLRLKRVDGILQHRIVTSGEQKYKVGLGLCTKTRTQTKVTSRSASSTTAAPSSDPNVSTKAGRHVIAPSDLNKTLLDTSITQPDHDGNRLG